jgi:hypothetical protein
MPGMLDEDREERKRRDKKALEEKKQKDEEKIRLDSLQKEHDKQGKLAAVIAQEQKEKEKKEKEERN